MNRKISQPAVSLGKSWMVDGKCGITLNPRDILKGDATNLTGQSVLSASVEGQHCIFGMQAVTAAHRTGSTILHIVKHSSVFHGDKNFFRAFSGNDIFQLSEGQNS